VNIYRTCLEGFKAPARRGGCYTCRRWAKGADDDPSDPGHDPRARGVCRHRRGRRCHALQGAIEDYDRALALDPALTLVFGNRAEARPYLRQYAEAIADYDKAIAASPGRAIFHANRGYAHLQLGQHERALADLTRAVELDPKDPFALANRGWAQLRLGRRAEAERDFRAALALNPRLARALAGLKVLGASP
jgi:tetratricopeptide (TPR) repeat protein